MAEEAAELSSGASDLDQDSEKEVSMYDRLLGKSPSPSALGRKRKVRENKVAGN